VKPVKEQGSAALRRADLRAVLERLGKDVDQRVQDVKRAADSETTVPPCMTNSRTTAYHFERACIEFKSR